MCRNIEDGRTAGGEPHVSNRSAAAW